jgi:hypothetical protein
VKTRIEEDEVDLMITQQTEKKNTLKMYENKVPGLDGLRFRLFYYEGILP